MPSALSARKKCYYARIAAGLCVDCSKKAIIGRRRCSCCQKNNRERMRLLKADRKRRGLCGSCGKRRFSPGHVSCTVCQQYTRDRHQQLRDEVFAAYGGYRCKCGENRIDCLQIDHMNNDGAAHRRQIGEGSGPSYRWLKKNGFPKGFQVLCANCNAIKKTYGYVPEYDKEGHPCLPKKHSRSGLCSVVQTKVSPRPTSKTASKKRQA